MDSRLRATDKAPFMKISVMTFPPFEENCYLAVCPDTSEAAVIDPGGDAREILARARAARADVQWILITHGHSDHIAGNAGLKAELPQAKLAIHEADAKMLTDAWLNLSASFGAPVLSPPADVLLHDRDIIPFGTIRLEVIHVPGHTPGGVAFYSPVHPALASGAESKDPVLFSGDALFCGSIGRADFPGGSAAQLIHSIRTCLLTLPPETIVKPGHGESTTLGEEAQSNPFLA
jgi:glyoxylase-like metal-dependent hydrolase (beta-lactamase superfamily II)